MSVLREFIFEALAPSRLNGIDGQQQKLIKPQLRFAAQVAALTLESERSETALVVNTSIVLYETSRIRMQNRN